MVEWVLAPVRARWQSPAWQATLGSPAAFMASYMPLVAAGASFAEVRPHVGLAVSILRHVSDILLYQYKGRLNEKLQG